MCIKLICHLDAYSILPLVLIFTLNFSSYLSAQVQSLITRIVYSNTNEYYLYSINGATGAAIIGSQD